VLFLQIALLFGISKQIEQCNTIEHVFNGARHGSRDTLLHDELVILVSVFFIVTSIQCSVLIVSEASSGHMKFLLSLWYLTILAQSWRGRKGWCTINLNFYVDQRSPIPVRSVTINPSNLADDSNNGYPILNVEV